MWWNSIVSGVVAIQTKTNKPNIASRESCFKAGGGVYPKDDPPSRGKALGCSEKLSRLVRSSWQLGCCSGHLIWHVLGGRVRVEDACVAKVILLAETKTTRQGDGCEELAIHGWFPPFWGIFGCKKSQPVDGRNQDGSIMNYSNYSMNMWSSLYQLVDAFRPSTLRPDCWRGGEIAVQSWWVLKAKGKAWWFSSWKAFSGFSRCGFCRFSYLERKVVVVQGVLVLKIKPIIWFYLACMIYM